MSEIKSMKITVSVDGFRMNLSRAFNEFIVSIKDDNANHVNIFDDIDNEQKEKLEEIRRMIGALNCIYDDDPDANDFTNLSEIKLETI